MSWIIQYTILKTPIKFQTIYIDPNDAPNVGVSDKSSNEVGKSNPVDDGESESNRTGCGWWACNTATALVNSPATLLKSFDAAVINVFKCTKQIGKSTTNNLWK